MANFSKRAGFFFFNSCLYKKVPVTEKDTIAASRIQISCSGRTWNQFLNVIWSVCGSYSCRSAAGSFPDPCRRGGMAVRCTGVENSTVLLSNTYNSAKQGVMLWIHMRASEVGNFHSRFDGVWELSSASSSHYLGLLTPVLTQRVSIHDWNTTRLWTRNT